MCFPEGEYLVGNTDVQLGVVEGCPFYIDARIYRSWNDAELILDVAPGDPEGFSLGPGGGQHFVIRSRAPQAGPPGRNAACEPGSSPLTTR
jgi:uncharacterized protein